MPFSIVYCVYGISYVKEGGAGMPPIDYGLVLAGGGAKGIYQIGAWRAIRELDIPITCVVGTSVGAMNGAMIACGQYEGAVALWENMSIEKGFALPEPLRVPDRLFSLKNADILLKELWRNGGLDISPIRRELETLVDEQTLRDSPVEFGLVTFELSRRQPRHLFRDQIPKGKLMDYIMASSAYPGLKQPEIYGHKFLDGGVVDNVPVKMMMRRHPDNIIVVNIGDVGLPKDIDPKRNIVYVKPLDSLGTAFEFQPETARTKMDMGWYDTMKAFGKFSGEWMYFPNEEYQRLRDELGENVVKGLEHAARLYGIDKLRVCTAEDFVRELMECDRVSGDKFAAFRSHLDLPSLLKTFYKGELKEVDMTSDVLLQLTQNLLDDQKERPKLLAIARRTIPDVLRAAEAMRHLRGYVAGEW